MKIFVNLLLSLLILCLSQLSQVVSFKNFNTDLCNPFSGTFDEVNTGNSKLKSTLQLPPAKSHYLCFKTQLNTPILSQYIIDSDGDADGVDSSPVISLSSKEGNVRFNHYTKLSKNCLTSKSDYTKDQRKEQTINWVEEAKKDDKNGDLVFETYKNFVTSSSLSYYPNLFGRNKQKDDDSSLLMLNGKTLVISEKLASVCNLYHAFRDNLLSFIANYILTEPTTKSKKRMKMSDDWGFVSNVWFHSSDFKGCESEMRDGGIMKEMFNSAVNTINSLVLKNEKNDGRRNQLSNEERLRNKILQSDFNPFLLTPSLSQLDKKIEGDKIAKTSYKSQISKYQRTKNDLVCFEDSVLLATKQYSFSEQSDASFSRTWKEFSKNLKIDLSLKCGHHPLVEKEKVDTNEKLVKILVFQRTKSRKLSINLISKSVQVLESYYPDLQFSLSTAVYNPNDICELFREMSDIDILISPHGFQLTLLPMIQFNFNSSFSSLQNPDFGTGVIEVIPPPFIWKKAQLVYSLIGEQYLGIQSYHQIQALPILQDPSHFPVGSYTSKRTSRNRNNKRGKKKGRKNKLAKNWDDDETFETEEMERGGQKTPDSAATMDLLNTPHKYPIFALNNPMIEALRDAKDWYFEIRDLVRAVEMILMKRGSISKIKSLVYAKLS